jgi:DNA-binding NarL/FixJ family response regulator
MITIILADDHTVVRNGLRLFLNLQAGMAVLGEAEDGWEAIQLVEQLQPQIAVLDIAMPGLNGIVAAEQIRTQSPATQVIMLSMHAGSEYVYQALKAGAQGYVLKDSAPEELVNAIHMVQRGHRFLTPKIADALITNFVEQYTVLTRENPLTQLSDRERQVLQLVVEGKTSAEISTFIALSPKTVDTYRSRLMQKLGIHDLPALVKFAVQQGITALE